MSPAAPLRRTIRGRVALATFAVLALLLATTGFLVDEATGRSARQALDDRLASEAEAVALLTHIEGSKLEVEFENDTMRAFATPRGGAYFEVFSPPRPPVRSESLAKQDLPPPSAETLAPPATPTDRRLAWSSAAGPYETEIRVLGLTTSRPLLAEGEEEARDGTPQVPVVVEVARSTEEIGRQRSVVRGALGIALPLALLLGTAAAFFVAGRATSPIARLSEEARQIGESTLSRRLDVDRVEGELLVLAATVNQAVDRLASGLEREKRFSADVAHEIRTPLATLRAELEATLLTTPLPTGVADSLRIAVRATERLDRVVTALLLLSRLESQRIPTTALDLRAAVLEAVETSKPVASAAGAVVSTSLPPGGVLVAGDATLLSQMLSNLIENAVRHGGPAATVEVVLGATETSAEVLVLDRGPGFPPDLVPRLFDRFARGDASRSRGTGGAGLGLAFARAVARAHGGDLEAGPRDGGGARLRLTLPLLPPVTPSPASTT